MTNYYEHLSRAHEKAQILKSIHAIASSSGAEIATIRSGMALVQTGNLEAVVRVPRRLSHCDHFCNVLDGINSRHYRQRVGGGIHQQLLDRMARPESLLSWEEWVEKQ